MNKKLEARISRLEKVMSRKNEQLNKSSKKFEDVDDSLYDMSGDEYTEDEDYMNDVHPKVVQWFKNFTKSHKLWNGVEKKNIAIIEDIADSEVVPEDIVDDCNSWVESDYYYSLGYLDYDIVNLCKKFLSTYTYPTSESKRIRPLKFSGIVNEQRNDSAEAVYRTANKINDLCKQLAVIIKSSGESQFEIDIDNALSMCKDDFPNVWFDRFNRINNGNL